MVGAESLEDAADWLADDIRLRRAECDDEPGTLVLYRANWLSRVVEEALIDADLPYTVVGDVGFWGRLEVRDALAYLALAVNPADTDAWERIANFPPRGLGDVAMERIRAAAGAGDLVEAGRRLADAGMLRGVRRPRPRQRHGRVAGHGFLRRLRRPPSRPSRHRRLRGTLAGRRRSARGRAPRQRSGAAAGGQEGRQCRRAARPGGTGGPGRTRRRAGAVDDRARRQGARRRRGLSLRCRRGHPRAGGPDRPGNGCRRRCCAAPGHARPGAGRPRPCADEDRPEGTGRARTARRSGPYCRERADAGCRDRAPVSARRPRAARQGDGSGRRGRGTEPARKHCATPPPCRCASAPSATASSARRARPGRGRGPPRPAAPAGRGGSGCRRTAGGTPCRVRRAGRRAVRGAARRTANTGGPPAADRNWRCGRSIPAAGHRW
ncbi:3'-5' exonuclease [Azospirillum aestuarii]|uniref:3'-5' exonuclease n=1 Tax=Azospirillum aestuarii TaxID=2802052 RepID=UPI0040550004